MCAVAVVTACGSGAGPAVARHGCDAGAVAGASERLPLLHVGGDAQVAGAQLAGHLLDLQLHCKGAG